ncbi:alpha/beta hydrolase [Enterococcus sp. DIV0876]|uniref:alpha/beta hydrolase n=1 Tax=Enterococcus sp. DIV0876 TaxID=2774633 RepID=UPI003D2F9BFB
MLKKMLKVFLYFILVLLSIAMIVVIAFQVSPRPGAYVISKMFDSPIEITDQTSYDQVKGHVQISADKSYDSAFANHTYDVYYPNNAAEPVPVLIWVHGGGYVGGDKAGVEEFATKISSDAQIAVVVMNYAHAPSSQYPNQVLQVNDLVKQLQKDQDNRLDLKNILFGGDSAGAQIALQYVAIQTNETYAKEMKMDPFIAPNDIKGTLSYSGPVDMQQIANQKSNNQFMKFFVNTVAWSLLGTKNWKEDDRLVQVSLTNSVSKDFPPTYITDGNAYSFQDQGIAFENKLKSLNVRVESLFFKGDAKEITHEYQFDYSLPESKKCYEQSVAFIKSLINN